MLKCCVHWRSSEFRRFKLNKRAAAVTFVTLEMSTNTPGLMLNIGLMCVGLPIMVNISKHTKVPKSLIKLSLKQHKNCVSYQRLFQYDSFKCVQPFSMTLYL